MTVPESLTSNLWVCNMTCEKNLNSSDCFFQSEEKYLLESINYHLSEAERFLKECEGSIVRMKRSEAELDALRGKHA